MTEPIFTHLLDELRDHLHHHRYDAHNNPAPEAPVSLLDTIRNEIGNAVAWGEDELRSKLPTVARLADDAEAAAQSPLVQAALSAVLPPAVEASLAEMIAKVDAELHAAAANVQAPAPAEAAADVPDGQPVDLSAAGPLIGGQAQ